MITLFDSSTNSKLAYLDGMIIEESLSITRQVNGEFTLKFEALESEMKSEYFQSDCYVQIDGHYFDLVYVEQQHSDELSYRIECEHVSYRLIDRQVPYYTFDGTTYEIISNILLDTDFQVGQIDSSEVMTFAVFEETNKLGLIQLLANKLGAEIGYDGFKIDLKYTVGYDRGYVARFGKNLSGVKKIIDRRSGLVCYSVNILELKTHPDYSDVSEFEIVEEGDTIRIIDEVMGLDVINKVIKRTYNPLRSINTSLEIANHIELLTDRVTKIQRDTIAKGKLYHGIRISPDSGFESIRSDKLARGIFNSDTFALQTGDGSGSNWTNRLYFDAVSGKYIFDGTLSATLIEALEAQFDVTVSYTTITNVLSAQYGNIAELTVDSLETSNKIARYYSDPQDISDMNFIRAVDNDFDFITAKVKCQSGSPLDEQLTNRFGQTLYWLDEKHTGICLDETDWPVKGFQYEEYRKMSLFFDDSDPTHTPRIKLGYGDGVTDRSATAEIIKDPDGLFLKYYKSNTEELVGIGLTDDGFVFSGGSGLSALEDLKIYNDGFIAKWKNESARKYATTFDSNGYINLITDVQSGEHIHINRILASMP